MKRRIAERYQTETKKANGPTHSPRGVLLKVKLRNFMCHDNLEVDLKPNINFICGRNGSGKSSILTAIILALSGKASSTGRSTVLSGYIKYEKSYAEIEVHLQNRGSQAYKPDVYGPVIIIERRIPQSGSSRFKIRAHNGKVQSEKAAEVNRITSHYGIQVDNPLTILNQDTCKQFIADKSKHEKYNFFFKATELERISDNNRGAQRNGQLCERNLKLKLEIKKDLEHKLESLEKQLEESKKLEMLRQKLDALKTHLTWAQIADKEMQIAKLAKISGDLEVKKEQLKQKMDKAENSLKREQEASTRLEQELSENLARQDQDEKEISAANDNLSRAKNVYRSLNSDFEAKKMELDGFQQEVLFLEQQIAKEEEEDLQSTEESVAGLKDQLAKKKEKLLSLEAKKTDDVHLGNLQANVQNIRERMDKFKNDEANTRREIQKCQSELSKLQACSTDNLNIFGNYTPALLRQIDMAFQKKLFKKKPIGPLGHYLKLRDQSWAKAIEACLKSYLYGYCVDNHKDHQELVRIMDRVIPSHAQRPVVIISPFQQEVYSGLYLPRGTSHPTIYHMLHISQPVVANCLIDQLHIESILLVADNKEARQLMNFKPPSNCMLTYTLCGDRIFPDPGFRYYSNNRRGGGHILKQDLQGSIKQNKELQEQLQRQLQDSQKERHPLQAELDLQLKQLADATEKGVILSRAISRLQKDISTLAGRLGQMEKKSTHFKDLLGKSLMEKKLLYQQKLQLLAPEEGRRKCILADIVKLKEDVRRAEENHQLHTEEVERLTSQTRATESRLTKLAEEKTHLDKQIKITEKEMVEATKAHEKMTIEFQGMEESIPLRPANFEYRSPELIKSEIQALTIQLNTEHQSVDSAEDLTDRYNRTKAKLDKEAKSYKRVEHYYKVMRQALNERLQDFRRIRDNCTIEADAIFSHILMGNGFRGKLVIDHENRQLDIKVNPFDPNSTVQGLSGGEKSFSTIAFFLALWRLMDSPFRILDEYDIFMDQRNRFFSTQLLVKEAERYPSNQYIFLTPLELQQMPSSVQCHVFRMADPREDRPIE